MNVAEQAIKAEKFGKLHESLFVLPNAWDVISAKTFRNNGFKAIGTTSAGIAFSHGFKDREMPFETSIAAIRQIAQSVDVPVSADIEDGYGRTAEEVAEAVRQVLAAGAVGINLEDSAANPEEPIYDIDVQRDKIIAIREVADRIGIPLWINARTDCYWLNLGDPASRLQETVARARAYHDAGADCVFIPGLNDLDSIRTVRNALACPINLLAGPNLPPLSVLADIGIERISCGSGPFRATVSLLKRIGEEMLNDGTFTRMTSGVLSYQELMDE